MGNLQGKLAVITGGTQGIGLATAKLFAREGAYVFITGRRQKELEEAVAAIGNNGTGVQGDVANLADLDRLYESVKAKGRIDVLFANVGLGGFVPLGSITEEYYDKTFDTNVKGLLFTVQKALPGAVLLAPHCQVRHSVVPFIAGTAMPLAAAPYRASGLVRWHLTDVGRSANVRFAPILLKKSSLADERNFSEPLMRSARGDVRDQIELHKSDHGPSYRP
jgi:NAD(P)-dependent dehydrogenase (short-subunit alcohol dehydrogenase family)